MIELYRDEATIGEAFVEPTKEFFRNIRKEMNILTGVFFGSAAYCYLNSDMLGAIVFFNLGAIANSIALESMPSSENEVSSPTS